VAAGAPSRLAKARKAYPLAEAARVLGVSPKAIRRCAAAGEFQLGRLGRQRMVPASWVEQYDPEGSAA
jgi:excisionase family DNA binding protein